MWYGFPIHDYHVVASSIPLSSGDAVIDGVIEIDTPKDKMLSRDLFLENIEPYCKVTSNQEIITIASYALDLDMYAYNLLDLDHEQEIVEETIFTYFFNYKYLIGNLQTNVETNAIVSCHIENISLE